MSNIRRLGDLSQDKDKKPEGTKEYVIDRVSEFISSVSTNSYAGGHRSGLAVEYPDEERSQELEVHVYSNGFTVGNGAFRSLQDSRNVDFLSDIREGRVPQELEQRAKAGKGELRIRLETHESEYAVPSISEAPSFNPFAGVGARLSDSRPQPGASSSNIHVGSSVLDTSHPITTLQIRLPGGNRITRQFNENSLGYVLVDMLCPALGIDPSQIGLSCGFPANPVDETSLRTKSLKELGWCNSVVTVLVRK